MKNILTCIVLFSASFFYNIEAQEIIKTDTINGHLLTITMDRKIKDEIEKLEKNCTDINAKVASRYASNNDNNAVSRPTTKIIASRELTNAEICRNNPRIMGYKIQLTVVKSNEEANEIKAYFRRRFPNLKVETDASLRPNYKILAGSYFNKQSASGDLAKIREFFKSAIPVQYRIFCVEAK